MDHGEQVFTGKTGQDLRLVRRDTAGFELYTNSAMTGGSVSSVRALPSSIMLMVRGGGDGIRSGRRRAKELRP
ncbi:MAG: hypothetical protein A6D92_03400 [Symbiobacterium thermophilum]|uniref:Uncharacterized protein n=1 Tax=Symbiobacterium thermophilum TaxID=2734 RepID=A0A1Y2T7W9_SYMTR|nr:MAG: hypothetical protein A6D92_03400 [Symbiobacterium thermophilum]